MTALDELLKQVEEIEERECLKNWALKNASGEDTAFGWGYDVANARAKVLAEIVKVLAREIQFGDVRYGFECIHGEYRTTAQQAEKLAAEFLKKGSM